jgi:[citrate (pro-3S)-lyase] ligase
MQGYHEFLTDIDLAQAQALLASASLALPEERDYGLGYYEDGALQACGFLAGNILCGFCVAQHARGGGIATGILSRLVLHGKECGINHFFIFTKAAEAEKFAAAGFDLVAKSRQAALLEQGKPCYADWLAATRQSIAAHIRPVSAHGQLPCTGAIVMNANPFTLGHEYLARTAAAACERLLVFVVEEDVSVTPFAVRYALVRQGLADVENALVLPSGPYMVSRASFPAYFTANETLGAVHAGLDCAIFATRIASDLGIAVRFVGTEPFDNVTSEYNAVMAREFAAHGLELREIPRLERDGAAVSASRVRALLHGHAREGVWRDLEGLLPPVTLNFLRSEDGAELRRRLMTHEGRH